MILSGFIRKGTLANCTPDQRVMRVNLVRFWHRSDRQHNLIQTVDRRGCGAYGNDALCNTLFRCFSCNLMTAVAVFFMDKSIFNRGRPLLAA
ncbi:hypothetical protein EB241_06250 [Erwinia psidii]|uniref:Uncharacterized protein n=1 Tax=Erwinia psidii TaxID=69224 RepID=A0A3N6V2N5_9GAMM|nr:hypothetical protein EB241_06250 [Erwinia psidii]